LNKKIIATALFAAFSIWAITLAPTTVIAWTLGVLLLTIYFFAFEVVEVDEAAITIMVLLGLTSLPFVYGLMGLDGGLVDSQMLFNGFASNAVISIIAVMIIGAGLDKTGLMSKVAAGILRVGGTSEARIIPIVSSTVGFISSFMQNVGAAALFLPVVGRISAKSGLPMSRLLMPMGFTAILGGTVTMVGSSPLILLNDLMLSQNSALPEGTAAMEAWSLFSVTPIGLALIAVGITYFVIAGRFVLPANKENKTDSTESTVDYFQNIYGISYDMFEVQVGSESSVIGMTLDDIETTSKVRVIAISLDNGANLIGPNSVARDTTIEANSTLAILASKTNLDSFVEGFHLNISDKIDKFATLLSANEGGMAELVIPPNSSLIGKSARDVWMRKTYGVAMVGLHRDGETMQEGDGIRDIELKSGDTIVAQTSWEDLERLEDNKDFIIITGDYPKAEKSRPEKIKWALTFFSIALFLVLFTDIRLSIALLTGALGMILSGVIKIEEAYRAVSWKTVFLLASLIPLGMVVGDSGTAAWVAKEVVSMLSTTAADGSISYAPQWVILASIATLATIFTLVMSNIGATILLVPIAVSIATQIDGANPAMYALLVAIATSNSFLIPTHQVNALIMAPGGYKVADYMKAGGIMTVLFLVVLVTMMTLFY
jgi:di/tricarboxylate transporter